MSDYDQASQLPTSRGAIDESRQGIDQKTPASGATGSPSDVDWSGISSGAEGAIPTGAAATGAAGYGASTGGSSGLGSEFGGTSLGSSASASGGTGSVSGGAAWSGSGSDEDGQDQGQSSGIDQVIGTATQRVGAIGDQVSSKASAVADQATTKADAGMEKAAGGLETLAGTLREKTEAMGGGQVQSIATTAADKLESGAEMLRQKDTDQLVSELEALVRQKPAQALLVAAGVGFLFSKALR